MTNGAIIGRGLGIIVLVILSWKAVARGTSLEPSGFLLGILDGANLIFHEAGHVLFLPFGEFLQYLGGSLTQVAIPVICAIYFFLHDQRSALAVTLFWTGESISNVAIYIADARRLELPLIGGNHDWNYLLDHLNLLSQAESIGRLAFVLGVILILGSLVTLISDFIRRWDQAWADD